MKYLKNKRFERDLKNNGLNDEYIKAVLDDIFEGRAISLGSKMYKIRGARESTGKSGGFRNIFFWKKDELIVFCLIYPKSLQDNINSDAYKVLRMLSEIYDDFTEDDIMKQTEIKNLTEIKYEREH